MMIGERIKKLRIHKGYSITELADLANVSKSYLSYIERNLNKNPSIHFLMKMANSLNVSLDYLLFEIDSGTLSTHPTCVLDQETKEVFEKAIQEGLKKEDFKEYISYIKFKIWEKSQINVEQ